MTNSDYNLARYQRQILLKDIGGVGQMRLRDAHIGIIGMGGIGAPLSLYLAGAGVGKLSLFDNDTVSLSNLHRQILYRDADIGALKVEAAKAALTARNPDCDIAIYPTQFEDTNIAIDKFDLLIDGTDNYQARTAINARARARAENVPLMMASAVAFEGQLALFDENSGCYTCLFPQDAESSAPCDIAGILGPVVGIVALMAANEAIKYLARAQNTLRSGRLVLFDGNDLSTRKIKFSKRPDCPICGHSIKDE